MLRVSPSIPGPVPTSRVRLAAALLGSGVGLVCMPMLAVAGFLGDGWSGLDGPPVLVGLRQALPDAFTWSDATTVMQAYGRTILPTLLVAWAALPVWTTGRDRRALLSVIRLGLILCLLGNITDYWLGIRFNEVVWRVGFGLLTMPGMLLLLGGLSALGWGRVRRGEGLPAILLLLTAPLGLVDTAFGLQYLPPAPLLVVYLITFIQCVRAWRAGQPVPEP